MGTAGLIGYIIDGKYVGGSFNTFDSNIRRLGKVIMEFLMNLSEAEKKRFLARLKEIIWVQADDIPSLALQRRYAHFAQLDEYKPKRFDPLDWEWLLRPVAYGRSFPLILNGQLHHLVRSPGYDTEYEYYIDMEKEVLWIQGNLGDIDVKVPFADFREGLMDEIARDCEGQDND